MTVQEYEEAMQVWIRKVQSNHFQQEIHWLKSNQDFSTNNKIKGLKPFIDANGILRVGGRLEYSEEIPETMKHPVILPRKHAFVKLIVRHAHLSNLHAGPQLLESILRQQYWIINIRDDIKWCIKNCFSCQRQIAALGQQLMGNLPKSRISQARAFLNVGVDYAGPVCVLPKKGVAKRL